MKNFFFVLGVFMLSFSVNASNGIVIEKKATNKEFSKLHQKVIMNGKEIRMFYDYCVSIGFNFCDGSCAEANYCSPWSWEEAYAWILKMQSAQIAYLETCEEA